MFFRNGVSHIPFCRDDDNEGSGGGGEPGGEGGQGAGAAAEPAWATKLLGEIQKLNALGEAAQARQQQQQTPTTEDEEDDDDGEENDPAKLELLSRADFGSHIVNQVLKAVNKQVVGPLNQQLNELRTNATRNDVNAAVQESASKHKDFWDWKQEMLTLAQQPAMRALPPESLYILARAANADKAKELDGKYNPPQEGNGRVRLRSFGGLTPGGGGGSGSKTRKMSSQEAATAAWSETIKALGGEPIFDEE